MIKKIFSVLLFLGVFCITSCFGYTLIDNCYMARDTNCTSYTRQMPCRELESGEEFTYDGDTYKIDNNANFYTYSGGQYINTLYKFRNISNYYYYNYFYWGEDNYLHKVVTRSSVGSSTIFSSGGVCIATGNSIQDIAYNCGIRTRAKGTNQSESCVNICENPSYNKFTYDINEFYNTNGGFDKIYFLPGKDVNNNQIDRFGRFCFMKGETGYCLYTDFRTSFCENFDDVYGTTVIDSADYKTSNFNLTNSIDVFKSSPFHGSSSSNEGNINDKTDYAIEYFESMGFRPRMCYVGTTDLTTNYGGTGSFEFWSGSTIFDLFESEIIYIEDTQLGYQAVSNWLNSWLINYDEWFSTNGNPGYLAEFYEFGELIHLNYYSSGDTPVFPFLNRPFAIYFMADNISSFVQKKSIYDYEGDYVVDYCNMKLNGATFNDMISKELKSSIDNQTSNNVGGDDFGSGSWGGSGSFIGGGGSGEDYTGTWSDLQFSGDVDLKSFFDNALNEMSGAIYNMQNPLTGVLPNYLIFALLLVVLFKVLRH